MSIQQSLKVILPVIRRVMPQIIAQDIIGVQPMTGPTMSIRQLKARYGETGRVGMDIPMLKQHYKHFLRVYNRRKFQPSVYLTSLGYQKVTVEFGNTVPATRWCKEHLKAGSFVRSFNDFWFAYDRDATLFSLRWS